DSRPGAGEDERGSRDLLTRLPNVLTLSRIAAIPVLVLLLYFHSPLTRWIALVLFVAAAITDYFDGYFARHRGEVSALGRFLDPIADKLLVASLIVILVAIRQIEGLVVIPAIVILCREILVSGLREYLAEIQVPLPVSRMAKWKTAIQMVALGVLIVGPEAGPDFLPMVWIGDTGLWIAALMTLVTGYDYLARGVEHMAEEEPAGKGPAEKSPGE
ncbi:MAG TPA: CDP-diacylglycerol--glycerol-3-phosphate 3-phosphatidyltransferase, partial [Kiloniellales bacterium]|nr:CDP-diacylglycerol--glycerol-3-phosphate 3-phosphatidyltransferase [Kiloniellales bacterium]